MLEHRVLRCFFFGSLLINLGSEINVHAAGHQTRKTGSGKLPSGTQSEPVIEGNVPGSKVEYLNDGPLGPLYDFLIQNRLQRLCLLLRKSNLENYLVESGSWTIFAPSDDSFAFLPGGTLEELERNPQLMQDFLLHHFIAGDLTTSQILDEMVVDSLQGAPLRFNIYGPPDVITVSGAEITQPDLQFELGRVHIIDRPLYPLPNYDLIGYLQAYHNELYKLIVASGLVEFISSGTFTIFAPDDKAFGYLSLELKDALTTNETLAQRVVLTHVLPASMFIRGFGNGMQMNSVGNADLLFTQRRGLTFVNGVPILTPDVPVTNGVIHVVNRVLLPEGVDADCQCKPLDSSRGTQFPGTVPGRPYESSRTRPASPSTITGSRPVSPPSVTGVRPVAPSSVPGIRPGAPSVTTWTRPGTQQQPGTVSIGGQRPGLRQPVVPITIPGQRPTSSVLPGRGQRPSTSTGAGLGQRQVVPAAPRPGPSPVVGTLSTPVPGKRRPFNPNRIPASRPSPAIPSTRDQRPWNPTGDTLFIEIGEDFEPAPTDAPENVPTDTQQQRPISRPPTGPSRPISGRPISSTGSRYPSPPIQQTRQPSHSQVPGARQPSHSQVPGARQPSHSQVPGTRQPSHQGRRPIDQGSFEDNTVDVQTGQYPDYDYESLTQRPGQAATLQPGRQPGQQTPLQPIPGRRPGQQTPVQRGQRPGQRPLQPIQRPSPQVPQQPGQRLQPVQRPGLQPGQQTQFQPNQIPGSQPGTFVPGTPSSVIGRRPYPSPPTRRTPAPFVPPTPSSGIPSGTGRPRVAPPTAPARQQVSGGRTTSLFPTRRPGQSSHSTKGQTYNPQRHNPQRRPANRPPASGQTALLPATVPGSTRQQFESNRQAPTCRRRGDRVTPATQSLPLCPATDSDFEPCQRVDEVYDPSDPRPLCPNVPDQLDCRQPGQLTDPNDYRPLCTEIEQPDCRMPQERPQPGDRRPLCNSNAGGRNTFSPTVSPSRQQQRPTIRGPTPRPLPGRRQTVADRITNLDCRDPGEAPTVGDRRPLCEYTTPQVPDLGRLPESPETQENPGNAFQPIRPPSHRPATSVSDCRQLTERPRPGDTRPVCNIPQTASQPRRPVNVPSSSPVLDTQSPENCRQPGERPTAGDRRPICIRPTNVRGSSPGQQPGSPQNPTHPSSGQRVSPQRPSPPTSSQRGSPQIPGSHVPSQQPGSPQVPSTIAPDQSPGTDLSFQPQQPGIRQPVRGTFTTRSPVTQPGQRGPNTRPQSPAQRPWQTQVTRQPIAPGALGVDDQVPPESEWGVTPDSSPGSQPRPQQVGRVPRPTSRPLSQPIPVRRPGSPGSAVSIPGTTVSSTSDGPRTLFEIVENPSLLIQGRPVKLTRIFELFQKAGLDYILTDPGPYTVFLPSDDAFSQLPKGVLEQLEADPNLLQQVLLFHVTTEEILPGGREESFFVPSFQGTPILVTMLKGGRLILISGAKAVAVTRASNGIFYVVNQLIYPLPQDDIVSALNTRPDLSTISSFIEISGLTEFLARDQPYTLFAPSDNAFSQLSDSAMQELMQNTTALRELLMGHIIAGAHYGREFLSGAVFPNIRGEKLKLNTASWGYQVNNVNIKTPEIVTGSGVIHIIDEVLLTPQDTLYIERLTNTLEGVVSPHGGTSTHGLTSSRSGSTASRPGSTNQGSSGWRSQAFAVSFGHTATRTQSILGTGARSPYPQTGTQPIILGTLILPGSQSVPGSPQSIQGSLVSDPGSNNQEAEPVTPENASHLPRPGSVPANTRFQSPGSGAAVSGHSSFQISGHQTHGSFASGRNPGTSGQSSHPSSPGQYSGVAQLASDIGLSRFASLIANSGLSEKIQDGGTYTVLAPTDEAINALPPDVVQALDADPNQLRTLLQYHILPQKLSSSSLGNDETASTLLEGKKLRFNKYNNGQVLTALGVPVDSPQDESSSVRLIPVNQVLQPPSGNLLKIIENTPYLTEFYNAIKKAHLNWMLNGESGLTLFAPSDAAFQALTDDQRKEMIDNKRNFSDLLKSHLVRGTLYSNGLQDGEQRRTENRKTLTFNFYDGGVAVNSIPLSEVDIPATNGVLHIIDQFL